VLIAGGTEGLVAVGTVGTEVVLPLGIEMPLFVCQKRLSPGVRQNAWLSFQPGGEDTS
jgi:hypothetical protein